MQPETADRWLDAWVLEATGRGLPKDGAYWQAGWDWIAEERAARRPGCEQAPTPSHQWLSAADGWGDSRMSQVYWGSRASEPLTIVGGWSMKVALRT